MRLGARLCFLAAAALAPAALTAQDVHLRGDDHTRAAELAREVLARNNYVRFSRDTVLPASFHATGDLVVVDADVRLEGQVDGSAVVLGGDLFLRPGAKITGPIAVIDGGVYPSGRSTYGPVFESRPSTRVTVGVGADSSLIAEVTPPEGPKLLSYGPSPLPTYDRVNGPTLSAGIGLNLLRREKGPMVRAWGSYRFKNHDDHIGGGASVDVPLPGGFRAVAEGSRATRTNDAWARGDLGNTFAALFAGLDYRDYYDADRYSLVVSRPVGKPLVAGESWFGPRIGIQTEQARSLATQHPWSLFGELDRVNPAIDEGDLLSVSLGAELHWVGRVSNGMLDAQVERGRLTEEGGVIIDFQPGAARRSVAAAPGDEHDFTQLVANGRYQATAFRTHTLRYRARVVLPFGDDPPPQQRQGILGGIPTIPTLEIGELRGDHLVFADGSYTIPVPVVTLPVIGAPSLELRHTVGAAWTDAGDREWVQNLGAGVLFSYVGVRVAVDPADTGRTRVFLVVSGPMM